MRVNAVCLQQFHQFIQLLRTCISTRRDRSGVRSYILLQCHRYTVSPLCSLLETANRPDADDHLLSHIEMSGHENSISKHEQEFQMFLTLQAWRHDIRDVNVTGFDSLNDLCRNETKMPLQAWCKETVRPRRPDCHRDPGRLLT